MENIDWRPLQLSLELALSSSVILLLLCIPIVFFIHKQRGFFRTLAESLIMIPLVLPPTVLGFYLLILFAPDSPIGQFLELINIQLLFSFEGLIVASVIYSLPFMTQPLLSGIDSLSPNISEAAYTMGYSKWKTFIKFILPNIKPALLSGMVLSFAHTMGEFGVVLMIGGNIPGETRVSSLAIWDEVEQLHFGTAHVYSALLFGISFGIIFISLLLNRSRIKSKLL